MNRTEVSTDIHDTNARLFARRQRFYFRLSLSLTLIMVPFLTWLQSQSPDSIYIRTLGALTQALSQAAPIQIGFWWLSRPRHSKPWFHVMLLVMATYFGLLFSTLVVFGESIGNLDDQFLMMLMSSRALEVMEAITVGTVCLAAAKPLLRFGFVRSEIEQGGRKADWTIRSILLSTTVVAGTIGFTKFFFSIAQKANLGEMPENGVVISLTYLLLAAVANATVILTAAAVFSGSRGLTPFLFLVFAAAVSWFREVLVIALLGEPLKSVVSAQFNPSYIATCAATIVVLFFVHLIVFHCWHRTGFRLARFQLAN